MWEYVPITTDWDTISHWNRRINSCCWEGLGRIAEIAITGVWIEEYEISGICLGKW